MSVSIFSCLSLMPCSVSCSCFNIGTFQRKLCLASWSNIYCAFTTRGFVLCNRNHSFPEVHCLLPVRKKWRKKGRKKYIINNINDKMVVSSQGRILPLVMVFKFWFKNQIHLNYIECLTKNRITRDETQQIFHWTSGSRWFPWACRFQTTAWANHKVQKFFLRS